MKYRRVYIENARGELLPYLVADWLVQECIKAPATKVVTKPKPKPKGGKRK